MTTTDTLNVISVNEDYLRRSADSHGELFSINLRSQLTDCQTNIRQFCPSNVDCIAKILRKMLLSLRGIQSMNKLDGLRISYQKQYGGTCSRSSPTTSMAYLMDRQTPRRCSR